VPKSIVDISYVVIGRHIFISLSKTEDLQKMECCAQTHIDNSKGMVELRSQRSNLLKILGKLLQLVKSVIVTLIRL